MNISQTLRSSWLLLTVCALVGTGVFSLTGQWLGVDSFRPMFLLPQAAWLLLALGLLLCFTSKALVLEARLLAGALVVFGGFFFLRDFNSAVSLSRLDIPALLCAAGYVFALERKPSTRLLALFLGACIILFGVLAQLSYWVPELPLAAVFQLPLHLPAGTIAALLLMLLGSSIIFIALPKHEFKIKLHRVVVVAAVAGSLATCFAWLVSSWQANSGFEKQSALLQGQTEQLINRSVENRIQLLARMAARWQVLGRLPETDYWKVESGTYLSDIKDLEAILVLNQDLGPLLSAGRDDAQTARILNHTLSPDARNWLARHLARNVAFFGSASVVTGEPSRYVVVGVPVSVGTKSESLLLGIFDSTRLFTVLESDLGSMSLRVLKENFPIYESKAGLLNRSSALLSERKFSVSTAESDLGWEIQIFQSFDPYSLTGSQMAPAWILILGLAGTFMLMLHQGRTLEYAERTGVLEANLQRQLLNQEYRQRIIDHSLDMLCTIDQAGRFIGVSPASFRILGYIPEELQGRRFMDFVHPDDHSETAKQAQSILDGSPTVSFRNRYIHRDGHVVHLRWSAEWSDEEKTIYAIAHDTSYLVLSEAYDKDQRNVLAKISRGRELKEILTDLCLMLEKQIQGSRCTVMLADDEKKALRVGAAPNLPPDYLKLIENLEIAPSLGSCGAAAYSKLPVIIKDIRSHSDWERLWPAVSEFGLVACWSMPVLSDSGEIFGTLAVYHFEAYEPSAEQLATVATAAELAAVAIQRARDLHRLEASEQRFRSLFVNNPDPVYAFDMQGRYSLANAAVSQLAGKTEEEIIGLSWESGVAHESLEVVRSHLTAAQQGDPQRFVLQVYDQSNRRCTLDVSYMPIRVNGQIEGVFGIAKDITERQQIAEALKDALEKSNVRALQLHAMSRAATSAARYTDQKALLKYLAKQVRSVVGADRSVISLGVDRTQMDSVSSVSASSMEGSDAIFNEISLRGDLCARVFDSDRPVVLSRAELQSYSGGDSEKYQVEHPSFKGGWLGIPLIERNGNKIGLLCLADKFENEFDGGDVAIAQQFAQITVALLDNNRLFSELLQAQEVLRDQLNFTRLITHSLGESLIAVNPEGKITFANPAARKLFKGDLDSEADQTIDQKLPLPEFKAWHELAGSSGEFQGEVTLNYLPNPLYSFVIRRMGEGWLMLLQDVTLERQVARALRERDHFFDLSLEMFCLLDLEGKFIQLNPAFAETLYYQIEELIGTSYLKLVSEGDREKVFKAADYVMSGGVIREIILSVRDGRGDLRKLQASAAIGEDKVVYCVAHDITERYAAEQEMQRMNLLLGMAGKSARLGGWSVETDGRVDWSPELSAILEYPPGVVPPLADSLALYHADDQSTVISTLEAVLKEGAAADLTVRIRTINGRWLDVRVTGQAVRDDSGQIIRAIGSVQDITDWKRMQSKADELSSRLMTTLESITDAFFMMDRNWCFSYVNQEAVRVLKTERSSMLGNEVWKVFPGSYESEIGKRYRSAMSDGVAQHFESYFEPFDAWYEVHAYPSGEGLAVYFRDVTAKKAADAELRHTMLELERSNRELQEFAYVASHDLQEPLRKIQTFSGRISQRASVLDEEGRDYLSRMNSAASRMQSLIIDLLNYSRVGTRAREFTIVNMNLLCADVISDLETALNEGGAKVEVGRLPEVRGDATQLRQVLQNLISNAIKFKAAGRLPIVRIGAEDINKGGWTLYVADNGIGFNVKYLDRIFAPFQRLHAREAYPGTGIGLAIVKKIIERHGASITATSRPGEGATFRIRFQSPSEGDV